MAQELSWLPVLVTGLEVTVGLAIVTIVASIAFAFVLAVCNIGPWRPVRFGARLFVDLFRSIPVLALILFAYYGVGSYIAALNVDPFWLAALALTIGESAFLSEVFRAGLEAIPRSQWEAATSLGFGWMATLRLVVVPQAVRPAIPGLLNMVIFTLKDSSLASLIAVPEVTQAANSLVSLTFEPLQVYSLLAALYVAVIVPVTLVFQRAEKAVALRYGIIPEPPLTGHG